MEFKGDKLIIDWLLGGKRYLKFVATDINTIDTGMPWSKHKDGAMHYTFSTVTVTHLKFKKSERDPYEIDFSSEEKDPDLELEKQEDVILTLRELNYQMIKTKRTVDLYFSSTDCDIYVPNHVHYGALIKALVKQIKFQIRWFKLSYKDYKIQNRIKLPEKEPKEKIEPRDFNLRFNIDNFICLGEDKPFSKCLIYQNEIISALKAKDLYHCDERILFHTRRKLKQNRIQEHYIKISKFLL